MKKETLQKLILDVVKNHPEGITHAQLVRYVLQSGYRHSNGNLSEDLMSVVHSLRKEGIIKKNLETRKITSKQSVRLLNS
jgi:hypothetical protein